jgi:hypothetical protein
MDVNILHKRKNIPSVSTALLLGGVLGLVQTLLLVFYAKPILVFMGVNAVKCSFISFFYFDGRN